MDQIAPRSSVTFAQTPWRHLLPRVLGPARPVPTMLSGEEEQLYFWLAAIWARGDGDIVDLGCFAGGSTARLALGHQASGHATRLHAYDRFTAGRAAKEHTLYPAGISPFEGNDILQLARDLLAPWGEAIVFHPGEIEDNGWDGGPIEILVSDAAKSASAADAIAETFFPHLLPGRSVLVSQDQMLWNLPWLTVQMELLSGCFTPVARCRNSSMVYLCTAVPDTAALERARVAELSDEEMIALLEHARPRHAAGDDRAAIDRMIAAVKANPKERQGWAMSAP